MKRFRIRRGASCGLRARQPVCRKPQVKDAAVTGGKVRVSLLTASPRSRHSFSAAPPVLASCAGEVWPVKAWTGVKAGEPVRARLHAGPEHGHDVRRARQPRRRLSSSDVWTPAESAGDKPPRDGLDLRRRLRSRRPGIPAYDGTRLAEKGVDAHQRRVSRRRARLPRFAKNHELVGLTAEKWKDPDHASTCNG